MRFYPEDPLDESEPQTRVWQAIQAAFMHEEGVAFYRYPIFDFRGLRHCEADFVVALRDYGLFVIEVKGLSINNIRGIQGHAWQTQNWYTVEEHPLAQVQQQVFALKKWLPKNSPGGEAPFVHLAVALPFVSRTDWNASLWHSLPTTQCVRCTEDLTPEALKQWVKAAATEVSFSPSSETWQQIINVLGQTTPLSPPMTGPQTTLIQFNGAPLDSSHLREVLQLTPDGQVPSTPYLFVVATSFLEVLRGKNAKGAGDAFFPALQLKQLVDEETKVIEYRPQLLFDNALRHMMRPWLPRKGLRLPKVKALERVYLYQAIDQVAGTDMRQRQQLRHDVATWREVLGRLDEEGIDLQIDDPTPISDRLAQPEMITLIAALQKAFHENYPAGEISFERAARRFIAEGLPAAPRVILEGFSFIRPLQLFFAQRCQELGAQVTFIHAYREEQEFGFEALKRTYASTGNSLFARINKHPVDNYAAPQTDLEFLSHHLFATASEPWQPQGDGTVFISAFPHRHTEVRTCVQEIAALLAGPKPRYQPRDIRIVSRDPDAYRGLLIEEVEMYRQEQKAAGIVPVLRPDLLRVPPRQLLLTPLGRFILTLYEIWDADEKDKLCLLPEHFVTILSSGLLSVPELNMVSFRIQQSAKRFLACRDQLFARCRTKQDWERAFAVLPTLLTLDKKLRLPSSGLLAEDVADWQNVFLLVEKLCFKLFNTPDRTVAEHIRNLQSGLDTFDPYGMADSERKLLVKIQAVLLELETADTTAISTEQFREVINGLVSERPEDDPWANQIAVIGPEGLDNSKQPIVFFLGADSSRLPRPHREPWPFYDLTLGPNLAQERYLFLAAIRATVGTVQKPARFFLSYAQTDGTQELLPSPYFQEVMAVLGKEDVRVFPYRLPTPGPMSQPPLESLPPTLMSELYERDYGSDPYTVAELMHYDLCPYRYQLERLDFTSTFYTTNFQLRYLAKGVWLHLLLDEWHMANVSRPGTNASIQYAETLRKQTEPRMKEIFLGFTEQDWEEVTRGVVGDIEFWCRAHLHNNSKGKYSEESDLRFFNIPPINVPIPSDRGQYRVVLDLFRYRQVTTANGRYKNPMVFSKDALILNWLSNGHKPDTKSAARSLGLRSHYNQVRKWDSITNDVFKQTYGGFKQTSPGEDPLAKIKKHLLGVIESVESGKFPKFSGEHCQHCPNISTCLGVSVKQDTLAPQLAF
ncbi:NERD domain-containing protein [Hymenobacter sp. BT559]|uniref:NERD domain-containing protein n=1 Tax=Hymenobacter sp. BT559 TaxID=2795729 RepID=UPI0018EBB90D|nr:NERD domain-containing protein [Hymenobacter sp. BT559]MBJ6146298.1 NERD domain-containing protein [Hymenobacter sp. BT559]